MYDLHNLGWHGFQKLCLTISREILGQTVESFLDVNDGGRDGAFEGTWVRRAGERFDGQFVIQCKFTNRRRYNLAASDLSNELEKVKRLVKLGRCDTYILMTNAGLSGNQEEQIALNYRNHGVKHVLLLGSTWICDQIQENKRLRMLVPRIYGLGDLSQILDERAYSQTRALLDSMREDLSKIVTTDSYQRAATALEKHGFVLLTGEPASGKTTIASLLSMFAIDQWNASPLKLYDAGQVIKHWNPDEPSQLFWIDDAFGITQYESQLTLDWNRVLSQIRTMIRRGARIVMTSRDYIYNRARKDLQESAFPLLRESQVVVNVHNLTLDEKRQILYNHMKMGLQPRKFRTAIKPFLENVAAHHRFVPEVARRLSDPAFTRSLVLNAHNLSAFVERQDQFLRDLIVGLDANSRAALAAIYMRSDHLISPISFSGSETRAIDRLGSDLGGCIEALESLRGSLVELVVLGGERVWRYKHPTIGDAYASVIAESPELIEVFIQGSNTEDLIRRITCGDVGYENAVVLGRSMFTLIEERLNEFKESAKYKVGWLASWNANRLLCGFLARRCSKEFLEIYIERHPGIVWQVSKPGLYLNSVAELDVALRFHELGILPEACRKRLIDTVTEYAVEGDDLYALSNERLRAIFTEAEYETLRSRVASELFPRLTEVFTARLFEYDGQNTPEDHVEPLEEALSTLRKEFGGESALSAIQRASERIGEWMWEHEEAHEQSVHIAGRISEVEGFHAVNSTRSIFDDVDT